MELQIHAPIPDDAGCEEAPASWPNLNIPVLVGVGDKDELFEVDKVRDFYNLVPGDKKEFFIMKNATHAKIPVECWEEVVAWLDKTYTAH